MSHQFDKACEIIRSTCPHVTIVHGQAERSWPEPLTAPQRRLLRRLPARNATPLWCSGSDLRVARALVGKGLARCTSHRGRGPVGPGVAGQYVRRA